MRSTVYSRNLDRNFLLRKVTNNSRIIWFSGEWYHLIVDVQNEMRRDVLLNRSFTPRCKMCMISRRPFISEGLSMKLVIMGIIYVMTGFIWRHYGFNFDLEMGIIWRMPISGLFILIIIIKKAYLRDSSDESLERQDVSI